MRVCISKSYIGGNYDYLLLLLLYNRLHYSFSFFHLCVAIIGVAIMVFQIFIFYFQIIFD
jgi:hypothetical protein